MCACMRVSVHEYNCRSVYVFVLMGCAYFNEYVRMCEYRYMCVFWSVCVFICVCVHACIGS